MGAWAPAGSSGTWVAAAETHPGGPRALLSVTERPGGWTGRVEIDTVMLPVSCSGWSTRQGAQVWCQNTAAERFIRNGQLELTETLAEPGDGGDPCR